MPQLYRGEVKPCGRTTRGIMVWKHQVIGPGGKIYAADNTGSLTKIHTACSKTVAALNYLDEQVTLIRIQPPRWLNEGVS